MKLRTTVILSALLLLLLGCRRQEAPAGPTPTPDVGIPTTVAEVTPVEEPSPTGDAATPTAAPTTTATPITAPTATATAVAAETVVPTPTLERIQFPPGATSETVGGNLVRGQRHHYIFGAQAGQPASVALTSAGDTASFSLQGVADGLFYKSPNDPSRQWNGVLPQNQDYLLEVNASQDTTYNLTLTIEPLPSGAIGGIVYEDSNGNDAFDPGEPAVANVQVYLRPLNCDASGLLANTVSAADGRYQFADLQPGDYCVSTVGSSGYVDSRPVTLTAGQSADTVHLRAPEAGSQPAGAIGGIVYEDSNGNDAFDSGEPAVANVQVFLRPLSCDASGLLATTVSEADGGYRFGDLQPGDYCVSTVGPGGYVDSRPVTLAAGQTADTVHLRAPEGIGGEARIQFPPGATETTVQGQLGSQAQAVYLFRASADQQASVAITSTDNSVLFHLEGVTDGVVYKHLLDGNSSWEGTLLETQDYRITLDNIGPGATSYSLELSIVN